MFIESGIIIFVGLMLLAIKLPLRISLRLLNHTGWVDLAASIIAYALHWGTFTGVMAAAVAGLMTSAFTSLARYLFGYIDGKNYYHPGQLDLTSRLNIHKRGRATAR